MIPAVPPAVLDFLGGGDARSSMSVGLVALALLLVMLIGKALIQSAEPFPRQDALNLFTVIAAPLAVVVFAIIVERFRDLS